MDKTTNESLIKTQQILIATLQTQLNTFLQRHPTSHEFPREADIVSQLLVQIGAAAEALKILSSVDGSFPSPISDDPPFLVQLVETNSSEGKTK